MSRLTRRTIFVPLFLTIHLTENIVLGAGMFSVPKWDRGRFSVPLFPRQITPPNVTVVLGESECHEHSQKNESRIFHRKICKKAKQDGTRNLPLSHFCFCVNPRVFQCLRHSPSDLPSSLIRHLFSIPTSNVGHCCYPAQDSVPENSPQSPSHPIGG